MLNYAKVCKTPDCGTSGTKAFGLCPKCYHKSLRAKGLCNRCCVRLKVPGRACCAQCIPKAQQDMKAYDQRRQEQAIANGLCVQHGCNQAATEGFRQCTYHRERKANQTAKRELIVEYRTVAAHYHWIQNGVSTYKEMPFFDGWNPTKGGSYRAGAYWIAETLGRRPDKKYQLHIIDRMVGFVPGNLIWVPQDKHRREEMIYKLLLEVQTLKNRYESS